MPVVAVKKTTRPRQQLAKKSAREGLPPSPPPPAQPAPKRASKRKSHEITRDIAPPQAEQQPSPPPPLPAAAQIKKSRRKPPRALPDDDDEVETNDPRQAVRRAAKSGQRTEEAIEDGDDDVAQISISMEETPEATTKAKGKKIALPFADTPVINRNKEMRSKTGGGRRSSLGMRGRRASSLIENGNNAIPHRAVETAQFYKHISSDGLTEPRRMKQLLTWCAERALAEKPPLGSSNANAVHGGTYFELHAPNL